MKVAIIGAGIAGLGAALALGRGGHEVHLYERDAAPAPARPEEMWAAWPRPGVPQAHHLHRFLALARALLRDRAPDVLAALVAAGATEVDLAAAVPGGGAAPGDEDLVVLRCRRPVLEGTLRRIIEAEPRVTVHAGRAVDGLLTASSGLDGVPRVVGVQVRTGGAMLADATVDAGGRRSPVLAWLAAAGARPPAEAAEESGLLYYGRYFALRAGVPSPGTPPGGLRVDLDDLLAILVEADNRTFVANFVVPAWDRELRVLHREGPFMAALGGVPPLAPWVAPDRAAPIGGVQAMGNLRNVLRRFVADGRPVALGLHVIGDALCHTNPANGAGGSLALGHAFALADVLADAPGDPLAQALAFDARTAADLRGRYELAVGMDRRRTRAWRGEAPADDDPDQAFAALLQTVLQPAAARDPLVFRAVARHVEMLDPPRLLERNTAVLERARALHAARRPDGPAPRPGPTREELLALVAALG